jgi:myo-inositol-1(or 4)-monophosphatase
MHKHVKTTSRFLSTAIGAARSAGAEALSQMSSIKSHMKEGDEVVTQADPICQKLIIDYICNQYPDHGILAEEGEGEALYRKCPPGRDDMWWIIDPIDGTNNYSHGVLSFSVSIGLFKEGRPLLGVIYIPASDTLFTGIEGEGAACNGNEIFCGGEGVNHREAIAIDSYWDNGIPDKLMRLIDESRLRNFGSSAIHLAYVSMGGFVAAVVNRNKLWDFAAGAAILQAAGGKITTHTGEDILPIDVGSYKGEQYSYVAANPVSHPQIVESLN